MLIKFDINDEKCKNNLINFIKNSEAAERKEFLKQFKTDNEFKIFFKFIVKNKIATLFKCRNSNNLLSLNTNGNYLNYLFIILMSDPYIVNFNNFFEYYNLNKDERKYINELFYFDIDYKEKINHVDLIKNIIDEVYSISTVRSYLDMKFKDITINRAYKKLLLALNFIEEHPNYFDKDDKLLREKIKNAFNNQFNARYLINTSFEPVAGLDIKRCCGSVIKSPTRTAGRPLINTVNEPVIDIPSWTSNVNILACGSHKSPTRTAGRPLINTSFEPETDFRGG